MDDIANKITEILKDKDSFEKISQMASSFMNSEQKQDNNLSNDFNFDPAQMGKIMNLMSVLKSNNKDDKNTKLLLALKPHLSIERAKKVDKAISILKIIKMIPLLNECGLNSLFEV